MYIKVWDWELFLAPWLFIVWGKLLGTLASHCFSVWDGCLLARVSSRSSCSFLLFYICCTLPLFTPHQSILLASSNPLPWKRGKEEMLKPGTTRSLQGWGKPILYFYGFDDPVFKEENLWNSTYWKCIGGAHDLSMRDPIINYFTWRLRIWKCMTKVFRPDSRQFAFTHSLKAHSECLPPFKCVCYYSMVCHSVERMTWLM